jgi:hypothetical protein
MRAILLATVAIVVTVGTAAAEPRSIRHADDMTLARRDMKAVNFGVLRDEVEKLRLELQMARQALYRQQTQGAYEARKYQDGVREAVAGDLAKAKEDLEQYRNKVEGLKALRIAATEDAAVKPALVPVEQINHLIKLNPGEAIQWTAPRAFKTVVPGNSEVADAISGETDRDLVIAAKNKDEFTNFLLLDGEGVLVANLRVQVGVPPSIGSRVHIHNKKDNVAGFTNYQCVDGHCFRRDDKMEGSDRVPPPSTVINQTNTQPAPAPTK